jgi:hypothetical protein
MAASDQDELDRPAERAAGARPPDREDQEGEHHDQTEVDRALVEEAERLHARGVELEQRQATPTAAIAATTAGGCQGRRGQGPGRGDRHRARPGSRVSARPEGPAAADFLPVDFDAVADAGPPRRSARPSPAGHVDALDPVAAGAVGDARCRGRGCGRGRRRSRAGGSPRARGGRLGAEAVAHLDAGDRMVPDQAPAAVGCRAGPP